MKRWANRLLMFIGILLILIAIFLFLKLYIENYNKQPKDDEKVKITKDKSKIVG